MSNGKSQYGVLLVLGAIAAVVFALLYIKLSGPRVDKEPAGSQGSGTAVAVGQPPPNAKTSPHAVDIDVFVDGSGSIQNFLKAQPVKPGANQQNDQVDARVNYLKAFLDKCEGVLPNAPGELWTAKNPRYFTFGEHVTQLSSDRGLHWLSEHPESFNARRTLIEKPVTEEARATTSAEKPAELKVIVTDLFENGGEMGHLANLLADKYLKSDVNPGAVGILGVRNPFSGSVEDLTDKAPPLPGAADSMPFYVILAGPAEDVRHGMDVLVEGIGLNEALGKHLAFQLFFSRQPQFRTRTLPGISPQQGARYTPIELNYKGSGAELISLSRGSVEAIWKDPAAQPDTRSASASMLEQGYELVPSAQLLAADGTWTDDPSATAATSACDDPTLICQKIDRDPLKKGATYFFTFEQQARNAAPVLDPGPNKLLSAWNIEQPDAEQISNITKHFPLDPSIGGHPGKTPDLSLFLTALQNQMFHSPVPIAAYYLYVQAN